MTGKFKNGNFRFKKIRYYFRLTDQNFFFSNSIDDDDLKDDFNNGTLKIANKILEPPNSSNINVEYKRGFILRKSVLQAGGKREMLGKRKWRCFFAVLRDSVLYLHKDDQSFAKSYDSVKNSIR